MPAPSEKSGLWLDGTDLQRQLKVGERFEISNPDKPAWCSGWFEVVEFLIDGRILCRRAEGPLK